MAYNYIYHELQPKLDLWITYYETNIDPVTNTSDVTVEIDLVASEDTYDYYDNELIVRINDVTYSDRYFSYDFTDGSRSKYLGGGTRKIAHNADGTGNAKIYVKAAMVEDNDYENTFYLTLTNIGRGTIPTMPSSIMMGSACTISTPRSSTNFTHTLYYKYGTDTTWQALASNVTTSYSWTPATATFAPKVPNAASAIVQIKCDTYNGASLVGSKEIASSVLSVPTSVVPTVSAPTVSGLGMLGALYVQGQSRIVGSQTAGAAGAYGSTIASSFITVKYGTTLLGNGVAPYTSAVINYSGSIAVTNTVTDTRGRSTVSAATTVTFRARAVPAINTFSVYRCTAGGTPIASGEYMKFTGTSTIASITGNAKTTKIEYKLVGAGSYTQAAIDTTNYNGSVTSAVIAAGATSRYEVRMSVQDSFSTTQQFLIVPATSTALSLASTEKGIAAGKIYNSADTAGQGLQVGDTAHFLAAATFDNGINVASGNLTIPSGRISVGGYDNSRYSAIAYHSPLGTLVNTGVTALDGTNKMIYLTIEGNGYANLHPIFTQLQGYFYYSGGTYSWNNVAQKNLGFQLGVIKVFVLSGTLQIWIPPTTATNYVTLKIDLLQGNPSSQATQPITTSNAAEPSSGVTYKVSAAQAYDRNAIAAYGGNNDTGWRKYGDGRMEQWKTFYIANLAVTTALGTNSYWYSNSDNGYNLGSWPVTFASIEPVTSYAHRSSGVGTILNFSPPSVTAAGAMFVVLVGRPDTIASLNVRIEAKGAW